VGIWHSTLQALGFQICTATVKAWKADLQLLQKDKGASRLLASAVLPPLAALFK
jgi:hypothetical protein